jgi:hypothetical protein
VGQSLSHIRSPRRCRCCPGPVGSCSQAPLVRSARRQPPLPRCSLRRTPQKTKARLAPAVGEPMWSGVWERRSSLVVRSWSVLTELVRPSTANRGGHDHPVPQLYHLIDLHEAADIVVGALAQNLLVGPGSLPGVIEVIDPRVRSSTPTGAGSPCRGPWSTLHGRHPRGCRVPGRPSC